MDAVGARAIPAATVPAIATDMSTIRICDMTSFSGCFFGGLEHQQYGRGIGSRVQAALLARSWSPNGRVAAACGYTGSLRDRKSTRLNSSHGSISYAVFCLKKKKKYKN